MTLTIAAGLPNVAPEDIGAAFEPFVIERLSPTDERWTAAVRNLDLKFQKPPRKERRWTTTEGVRTPELVRNGYEGTWTRMSLREEIGQSKPTFFEWRDHAMIARAIGRKRVHQLLLARVLEWLAPASVLEVGFGYGLNLLLLAMQFPGIRFSGVELTDAGLAKARSLARDPTMPGQLAEFAIGPLRDREAPARLDLRQGSADALPFEDKSVDMAITVLALEQMERIRDRALRELSRVARRHVVMVEPFADWNLDGHRREYIRRHDYFAAKVEDLLQYGLVPLVASVDMPNKLSFRAGLVVAAVESLG